MEIKHVDISKHKDGTYTAEVHESPTTFNLGKPYEAIGFMKRCSTEITSHLTTELIVGGLATIDGI